jgi:hypothetical protein
MSTEHLWNDWQGKSEVLRDEPAPVPLLYTTNSTHPGRYDEKQVYNCPEI